MTTSGYVRLDGDGNIITPYNSGQGMSLGNGAEQFGWRDIIGTVRPKASGAGRPTLKTYRGGSIEQFAFAANDEIGFEFHIPHDYLPDSDIYFHIHWSHNGTAISGNAVFTSYVSYAKGHDQANFSAEVSPVITYNTVDVATTPQYRHRIDELQISAASPSGTQIDSNDLEVDGLILVNTVLTTLPTITSGDLFIHFADIHYQSVNIPTRNKAPNFYT